MSFTLHAISSDFIIDDKQLACVSASGADVVLLNMSDIGNIVECK